MSLNGPAILLCYLALAAFVIGAVLVAQAYDAGDGVPASYDAPSLNAAPSFPLPDTSLASPAPDAGALPAGVAPDNQTRAGVPSGPPAAL